jgi:hypothetical protein
MKSASSNSVQIIVTCPFLPSQTTLYYYSGKLGFWTLSIVRYSKEHKFAETGCFRPQVRG